MKKINVLFVMLQMSMGGSERLVHTLARELDRSVFNVSVAWFYGDHALEEFQRLDVPLYHVPKKKRFDLSAMARLGFLIREKDIDVVNAHHFMSMVYSFYGARSKKDARLVYTEHSEWEIDRISRGWKMMGRFLLKRTAGAIGVSPRVSRKIETCFNMDSARVATITNGATFNAAHSGDKISFRRTLGLRQQDFVIGTVANFKKIKNHLLLLNAFRELRKKIPEARLLLAGQGFESDPENSEREIRGFVREHQLEASVLFLGYRSDIPQLLSILDIFCLPSFKEGLPISLVEAMAAGLPVVGTDVEGIREVITHGENGFLVRPGDTPGLQNVFSLLSADEPLRRRLGNAAQAEAAASYSLAGCVKRYQDLFLSVCAGPCDQGFSGRTGNSL